MLRTLKIIPLVCLGFGFSTFANAQGVVGAYEKLSSGNKKVAEALFNGQVVTDDGKAPLSLDQIARAKRRSGWGRIFKNLKKDGLLDAKSLRELTSGRYEVQMVRQTRKSRKGAKSTVVTTGSGRQIIVDKKSSKRRGRNAVKHTEKLFSSGSTYRGRLDNSAQSKTSPSLGITSARGKATGNIIMQ
jgi:hypothetical protein